MQGWAVPLRLRALVLAVVAGAGGLGSELVWLRVVEHTLGHLPLAAPAIVACFIVAGGLGALLAARVRRPGWVALGSAALELLLLLNLERWSALAAHGVAALSARVGLEAAVIVLGAALTVPPALCVGVVLPSVMEAAGASTRAYALHALGAVLGVVALEAWVLPSVGVRGALGVLVVLHGATAAGLASSIRGWTPVPWGPVPWVLVVAGAGTGAVQGGWLASLPLVVQPLALVAPAVVATMLLGLTLGAALVERRGLSLERVLVGIAGGVAVSLTILALVARGAAVRAPLGVVGEVVMVVLPSAVAIGGLLPAYLASSSVDRARAGGALLAVSLGNALGLTALTAAVGAWLPGHAAVALGAVLVLSVARVAWAWRAVLVLVVSLTAALTSDRVLIARSAGVPVDAIAVRALFRSPGAVSAVFSAQGRRRLYQSGYQPIDLDAQNESIIGAVAAAYAPRLGRALVLGAGSGRTAGAIAAVFAEVDVVDLDPHTEALCRALADDNFRLLEWPGVRVHRYDALLAPYVLPGGYDLVVQTVDPGYHALAAKLYTVEHLTRLAGLLRDDGVLVYWADATLSPEANQVLVNTGRAVLPHQKLFAAFGGLTRGLGVSYYFLVHSARPLSYQPRMMRYTFGQDAQVRALPLFGGYPPGAVAGARPVSLDLEPPPPPPEEPERYRLIRGRFHETRAVHRADRPAPSVVFGGAHDGLLEVLPEPVVAPSAPP